MDVDPPEEVLSRMEWAIIEILFDRHRLHGLVTQLPSLPDQQSIVEVQTQVSTFSAVVVEQASQDDLTENVAHLVHATQESFSGSSNGPGNDGWTLPLPLRLDHPPELEFADWLESPTANDDAAA